MNRATPLILLATSTDFPDGEPGHAALDAALAARDLESRWAVWDDPTVDWGEADVVAVRSTWDYDGRLREFLGWAAGVGPSLLNGADVFRWNTDKGYLVQLAEAGLPVVPTVTADDVFQVRAAAAEHRVAVVKPRIGAGGRGVELVADPSVWLPPEDSPNGPWVVQPLVESIRDRGESSVFVLGGRPVSQVDKRPAAAEIRVHQWYGGSSRTVELDPEAALLAADAVAVVGELLAAELAYARVDLLSHEGRLVVAEVEVTEPALYLDVLPLNAEPFADAVAARVATLRR